MPKFIDITGQQFGRLQVIEKTERNKHGVMQWRCACRCGNETVVTGNQLRRGKTKSCGCKRVEYHKKSARDKYPWCRPNSISTHIIEDLDDLIKG
jgi:hypothetical protein